MLGAMTVVGAVSGCGHTLPLSPPTLPTPRFVASSSLAAMEFPPGRFSPPPPVVLDPILASKWGRHPDVVVRVDRWIEFWTGPGAAEFNIFLARLERFRNVVEPELRSRGLPPSLIALPIIESGYLPSASSGVGAVGLWQFMAPTARGMGLSVGSIVDERRDPVRATPLALEFLAGLHRRFDSWFLTLAAYNAGPARIEGLLRRHAPLVASSDSLYVALRPVLPRETRDFVPKLLAAITLASNPGRFGLSPGEVEPFRFEEVAVPDATSVDVMARVAEVPQTLIEALNPQLLRGFTPAGESTVVRVPEGSAEVFAANYAKLPERERITFLEHRVASGETFSHIARRYGVRLDALQEANPRIEPRRLQIGQWVIVPRAPRPGEGRGG